MKKKNHEKSEKPKDSALERIKKKSFMPEISLDKDELDASVRGLSNPPTTYGCAAPPPPPMPKCTREL